MPHNSKIWPAGLTDGVSTLDDTELEGLDTYVYESINGDQGGTWAPAAAIVIGGAGIDPTLKAAEWPNFAADAGAKRTLVRVCFPGPVTRLFSANLTGVGLLQGQGLGTAFCRLIDWVPNGATITLIKCRVTIINSHGSLPTTFPMMTVRRIDLATGSLTTYLKTTDAGAGVNEFFVGAPVASTADYNANGSVSFTYTPDQNNVVDRTLYSYVVEVFDESGGGAILGNMFIGFEITFTLPEFAVA